MKKKDYGQVIVDRELEKIKNLKIDPDEVSAYYRKIQWLEDHYPEVTPEEFYRDVFPEGRCQQKWKDGSGLASPIATFCDENFSLVLLDSQKYLYRTFKQQNVVCRPNTYFGTSASADNIHEMFGLVIDLDDVDVEQLDQLEYEYTVPIEYSLYMQNVVQPQQPTPTYIVFSGHGLHLYYLFIDPIKVYSNLVQRLNDIKQDLIRVVWKPSTSERVFKQEKDRTWTKIIEDDQTIHQGYRMVGSASKLGANFPVRAFRVGGRVTLDYFNPWLPEKHKVTSESMAYHMVERKYSYEEAIAKFEETGWHPPRFNTPEYKQLSKYDKKKPSKKWHVNPALYEYMKKTIVDDSFDGNRYRCIMVIAAIAKKCDIPFEEVEKWAYSVQPLLDQKTKKPNNHFTHKEVKSALRFYGAAYADKLTVKKTYEWTKIKFKDNRRHGRKQKIHLKAARAVQDVYDPEGSWRNKNGAPTKKEIIEQWRLEHPNGTKIECEKDKKLSRHTVIKWWGEAPRQYNRRKSEDSEFNLTGYTAEENAALTQAGKFKIPEFDK